MALPGRRVLILYGSETGNGQEKAGEIDRLCQRLRFSTELEEMDSIKLNTLLLDFNLVVFVISTTGQGQFPRNSRSFWKSLRRAKLPPNCLESLRFTTFGLGDSAYQKFNWASRLLNSRLLRLGAKEVFERGEADERHNDGIDSIYQPWVQNLREYLLSSFPLPPSCEPIPDGQPLPPRYSLKIVPKIANGARNLTPAEQLNEDWDRQTRAFGLVERTRRELASASIAQNGAPKSDRLGTSTAPEFPSPTILPIPNAALAKVLGNKRVTPPDHWQDVRLLTLETIVPILDDQENHVRPGDVLVLYPQNYPSDVQTLIDLMGWGHVADVPVEFAEERVPVDFYMAKDATLRDILTNNVDITAVPARMFLEKLADFATNADQKEKLLELVKPDFSTEFYDFTSRPRRTILEVLSEFTSARIPVANVPDIFPIIRGREYSIANGGRQWDKEERPGSAIYRFELLVALVEYRTIIRKPRQGLCSRYIKHLPAGRLLRIGTRSQTRPPSGPEAARRPMIAIAAGTGVAPIRSLVHERTQNRHVAETLLFFGCRNRAADYFFNEEWANTPGMSVVTAFSRDPQPDGGDGTKTYVQHMIRQQAERVCQLLAANAIICVCGNSGQMPKAVREALREAAVAGGFCQTEAEAEAVLFSDKAGSRVTYWEETW